MARPAAEIGDRRPDGGAGNPADPRLLALAHADRPRPVRRRAQRRRPADLHVQLLRGHAAARRAERRRAADDQRGPINAAYPPKAPAPAAEHVPARLASTSRTTSRSARSTTGTRSPQAEYDAQDQRDRPCDPRLPRRPGRGRRAGGRGASQRRNALTGLAAALGNYTPYIAANNDERGIAPGLPRQERRDGDQPAHRCGQDEPVRRHTRRQLRPRGRQAVRPRAVRAGHPKGDLDSPR